MFNTIITEPLTNLVLGFYQIFGQNLGLAIIFFTIFLRFILLPLTIRQIKQQRKIAELQPRLQELQAQRKEGQQMSPEEVALMRQTAGSCLGGCLPLLVQIPILIGLNHVITKIATAKSGDIFNNSVYFDSLKHSSSYHFNTDLLGFDLAGVPSKIGFNPSLIPYIVLIALLIVTQIIQSKMMTASQKRKDAKLKKPKANQTKISEKDAEKIKRQEDMQKMMQVQTTYFIPVAVGLAAYSFPAALGLYWLTQNVFAIVQTFVQNKIFDEGKTIIEALKFERKPKIREAKFENISEKVEERNDTNELKEKIEKKRKKKKNKVKSSKKK